jgi:WD40 repeat protein
MLGLSYDPESKRIATGGFDGSVQLINVNFAKRHNLSTLSVKELKEILKVKNIDFSDCFEKADLVRRIETSRALPLTEVFKTYHPHTSVVVGVDLQGRMLATGSRDSNVNVQNVESNSETILRVTIFMMLTNCS